MTGSLLLRIVFVLLVSTFLELSVVHLLAVDVWHTIFVILWLLSRVCFSFTLVSVSALTEDNNLVLSLGVLPSTKYEKVWSDSCRGVSKTCGRRLA